jgi:hypothetical protein
MDMFDSLYFGLIHYLHFLIQEYTMCTSWHDDIF